jgi:hypothetical protein
MVLVVKSWGRDYTPHELAAGVKFHWERHRALE